MTLDQRVGRLLRFTGAAGVSVAITAALLAHGPAPQAAAEGAPLETAEISALIDGCLHFAGRVASRPDLTVAVVDTEGNALAVFHAAGVPADPAERANRAATALAKAGTGAYFSSDDQTFSTRSAAFIIQDHFPPGLRNIPGGPLYGVEFSSFVGSDVNPIVFVPPLFGGSPGELPASFFAGNARFAPGAAELRVRGELGGIGLYRGRRRVGALGVDDGSPRNRISVPDGFGGQRAILSPEGCRDEYRITFGRMEAGRDLERIVLAAGRKFLAPKFIRATEITVDGIRLPYGKATGLGRSRADGVLDQGDGAFDPAFPLTDPETIPSHFTTVDLPPPPGSSPEAQTFKIQMPNAFPVRAGTDGILSESEVRRLLYQGVQRANITRAAIRRPIGLPMQCWVSVVDTFGEVLGVARFGPDATLFSYDVAVQKARTAAFFSDSKVAFSCRGLGLCSQNFFPAGQQDEGRGPMFQIQDGITVGIITGALPVAGLPIRNGITVFPGGVPLYKGGQLAGGLGVSGDGVDQDDIVADFGSRGFGASGDIRCDKVGAAQLRASLGRSLDRLEAFAVAPPAGTPATLTEIGACFLAERIRVARQTLARTDFDANLPFVKHPRHPGPVTIRR